jgi:hypothetical protein
MRRTFAVIAIAAFTLSLAGAATATPALDAKGKCRDAGKFVAASMCASPAAAATPSGAHPKNCKKGKACGNTCISVKDVCHK